MVQFQFARPRRGAANITALTEGVFNAAVLGEEVSEVILWGRGTEGREMVSS